MRIRGPECSFQNANEKKGHPLRRLCETCKALDGRRVSTVQNNKMECGGRVHLEVKGLKLQE